MKMKQAQTGSAKIETGPAQTEEDSSSKLRKSRVYTTELDLKLEKTNIPCFRIIDEEGEVVKKDYKPSLSVEKMIKIYETMSKLTVMDKIFYDAQRQGRISFFMQHMGEQAALIASAAALDHDDVVYTQYREAGVYMWRGFDIQQMSHQCYGNVHDYGKGRQMPIHYGSRASNVHTVSSPLATQIPHAAGAAYALKLEGKPNVGIAYFGDGAASEGDFHAALNFAATLGAPALFFCRNNAYAISTPIHEQYVGDGIVCRAPGYGMRGIRVDGNDFLAVYEAVSEARKTALENNAPVLIEAMTYRLGHHSTSDDSTAYRDLAEMKDWETNNNPLTRARLYLEKHGEWDSDREGEMLNNFRKECLKSLHNAVDKKFPPISQLFTDVYDDVPWHLEEQREELMAHLSRNPEKYSIDDYVKDEDYEDPRYM
eukprot:CAMPEP_0167795554 /NCGR_PEP_ID=MMETSP0111_2-20121227/14510_1 /TAXON_ID=91324 /ORGANISM="Lotharella globosa, Strain CCCM811" /LENGTH=426 /DNA_ID=CAMNT_0007689255 /DNA_START=45 /DNA_END=1325 /DNA_ORIENTATION=+